MASHLFAWQLHYEHSPGTILWADKAKNTVAVQQRGDSLLDKLLPNDVSLQRRVSYSKKSTRLSFGSNLSCQSSNLWHVLALPRSSLVFQTVHEEGRETSATGSWGTNVVRTGCWGANFILSYRWLLMKHGPCVSCTPMGCYAFNPYQGLQVTQGPCFINSHL